MEQLPNLSTLSHDQKDQLILNLWRIIKMQSEKISKLEEKIKHLEDRLSKNSGNSSKPPSSDGFNKPDPKSRRDKNKKKKVGGQKGHKGVTLRKSLTPDKIELYDPEYCHACDASLVEQPRLEYEGRQTYDLPPLALEVTEHRAYKKCCPDCNFVTKGQFPSDITQPVQYGSKIKAVMVYLNQYQLLPFDRTREFFSDIFNQPVSVGTILKAIRQTYEHLEQSESDIKKQLINAQVLHADETGLRVNKETRWLHVACTEKLTLYGIHAKRGREAMDEINVLPDYKGTLIHDHLKAYFHYGGSHGLCNAHHLRELTFISERYEHEWSEKMEDLLVKIKKTVEAHYAQTGHCLPEKQVKRFQRRYMKIISEGKKECPMNKGSGKKGRIKQSKAFNLLNRLRQFNRSVLGFMYNPLVPFDNNQAERDLRMMKVQQKISGCFRSEEGIKYFCRIRGYISTAKKQGYQVIAALQSAIQNQAIIFGS